DRGDGPPARRRTEDGERRPRRRLRDPLGHRRGYAHGPRGGAARSDEADRPGQDRKGPPGRHPARGMDLLLDRHDPARALRLPGPPAALRDLPAELALPVESPGGEAAGREDQRGAEAADGPPPDHRGFAPVLGRRPIGSRRGGICRTAVVVGPEVNLDPRLLRLADGPAHEASGAQPAQELPDPETLGTNPRWSGGGPSA